MHHPLNQPLMQPIQSRTPASRWMQSCTSLLIALFGLGCLLAGVQQTAWGQRVESLTAPHLPSVAAETVQTTGAATESATAAPLCPFLSAVTRAECAALVALYESTNGAQWQNRTNWLTGASAASPCDWYGVRCAGGHVIGLNLASNGLQGALPPAIGAFPALTRLLLADNLLSGSAPPAICDLVDTVTTATFAYNQLRAATSRIQTCLDRLQPGWMDTQTTAPFEVHVTAITTGALQLTWAPIPYTGDGGYYEIGYSTSIGGEIVYHGATSDKSAGGYLLDGLEPGQSYHIAIRTYTPAHPGQENEQRSSAARLTAATRSTAAKVLALIYFPADNDLSPYLESVIRRIRYGTLLNPNVQVLLLADARGPHNTVLLHIADGVITRTNAVKERWDVDELDTTDPNVLAWFLTYGRTTYPASRTVVSLMGHGVGMMPEVTGAPLADSLPSDSEADLAGIPALPQTIPSTPGDENDMGAYFSTADFAYALAAATDNGANPFDVLFFDQCFQGNLDVLYELRAYARTLIASPSYAWLVAPYHKYLPEFTPTATPEAMADAIIYHYQQSLTSAQPNVIFWVRGADLTPITQAVNQLGGALQNALATGYEATIAQAARKSQYVDTTQCGRGNLILAPPDELLGAGSFAAHLSQAFGPTDSTGVYQAANAVITQLELVHSRVITGHPSIAPDSLWNYTDTITLLAPLDRTMSQREMMARKIWRGTIYQPTAPVTAVWAPTPRLTVTVDSAFSSAREGQWDDFLHRWYTNPLTPTVGEHCNFMPTAIVPGEITETLSLTYSEVGQTVVVDWNSATDPDTAAYWLLARPADTFLWRAVASTPVTQTTLAVQKPAQNLTYELQIVAENELGVTVAESNLVTYAAIREPEERRIFLPIIRQ
ncbi:MAG: clostripain-related cysteine peptidase [Caldilineaceae bacterium]